MDIFRLSYSWWGWVLWFWWKLIVRWSTRCAHLFHWASRPEEHTLQLQIQPFLRIHWYCCVLIVFGSEFIKVPWDKILHIYYWIWWACLRWKVQVDRLFCEGDSQTSWLGYFFGWDSRMRMAVSMRWFLVGGCEVTEIRVDDQRRSREGYHRFVRRFYRVLIRIVYPLQT